MNYYCRKWFYSININQHFLTRPQWREGSHFVISKVASKSSAIGNIFQDIGGFQGLVFRLLLVGCVLQQSKLSHWRESSVLVWESVAPEFLWKSENTMARFGAAKQNKNMHKMNHVLHMHGSHARGVGFCCNNKYFILSKGVILDILTCLSQ